MPVTPHGASQALHALHAARHADNLRIEIAAARVLDAYCQGRLVAAEDDADVDDFLSVHPIRNGSAAACRDHQRLMDGHLVRARQRANVTGSRATRAGR